MMLKVFVLGIGAAVFVSLWDPMGEVSAVDPEDLICDKEVMPFMFEAGLKKVAPNQRNHATVEECEQACLDIPNHKCVFYWYKESNNNCAFFATDNHTDNVYICDDTYTVVKPARLWLFLKFPAKTKRGCARRCDGRPLCQFYFHNEFTRAKSCNLYASALDETPCTCKPSPTTRIK